MKTIFKILTPYKSLGSSLLLILILTSSSCKKADNLSEPEQTVVFAYEADCNYCNISYTDSGNQTQTVKNNMGKWSYKIEEKISFDLKLSITTTLQSYQSIQAYILKDDETIFGSLGYNRADISYNAISGSGQSSFGSYISTTSSPGSGTGGTSPTSTLCGAKNKTGGYCKRMVVGGGRCWQHK